MASPVFSLLKRALPEAIVDAFLYRDTLPMLEGHPAITSFHLYDRAWKQLAKPKKLFKEIALLRTLRQEKYDLVLNLTEGDRGAIAALVSGASYRVGFDPEGKGFKGKRGIYTHVAKNCPQPRHTVERQLDLLRRVGIFPLPEERDLTLQIPEEAHRAALALLPALRQTVIVHPVSRWRFKCLPVRKIAELLTALHARGLPIALTASGDPQEVAMCEQILALCPRLPVANLAGKSTLKELSALIAGCRGLITVDSLPLHIASATKTPLVALFGPTSERNWGPWMHPRARVVAEKLPCRPCLMDGCGGSKMSDCLFTMSLSAILDAVSTTF